MTRKYNPGLFPALIAQWQAEDAIDELISSVHERRVAERAEAKTLTTRLAKTEAHYRETLCQAFDADMTRREFYYSLLESFGLALFSWVTLAGLAAVLQ